MPSLAGMEDGMAYVIGVVLAVVVCGFATVVGLDRDRAFYPTITMVIASYYGLFAVMGGSTRALFAESVAIIAFLIISIVGFKRNLWLLVAALAGHGVFDFVHANVIADPGVPRWWPAFCLAFDVVAAAYLATRLSSQRLRSRPASLP
jgi:hypothetical protein